MRISPPIVRTAALLRSLTGLQRLRERKMKGAVIMVYHGVVNQLRNDPLDTYQITRTELAKHVRYLKSFTDVVSLPDLLSSLEENLKSKQRLSAITFDDALESQTSLAAEVMVEMQVPWSIAVPAGLVEKHQTVWTNLLRLIVRFLPCDSRAIVGGKRLDHTMLADCGAGLVSHLMHHVSSHDRDMQMHDLLQSVGPPQRIEEEISADGRFKIASWTKLRQALTAAIVTSCPWLAPSTT